MDAIVATFELYKLLRLELFELVNKVKVHKSLRHD